MKIAVVGTGYVGLVTGTCFAESGHEVTCIDNNEAKIALLRTGGIPIYEPGLQEMVQRNSVAGRLHFTTDLAAAVQTARVIFIAVGTPQTESGAADLRGVYAVIDELACHLNEPKIVVIKSTVPVGTNAEAHRRMQAKCAYPVDLASNPEFLKEGAAITDCMKPDRVVVGVRRPEVAEVLEELYQPFLRADKPFLVMSPESAEMTKYVANALLATKISFINEMANLCEVLGADINDVRKGIGHDQRIGFHFLFPGPGFGGSCFPKDIAALYYLSEQVGRPSRMMRAVNEVNEHQKQVLTIKLRAIFGDRLGEKTIAVWGLSFKPRTDDIREAPSLVLLNNLIAAGAAVRVHDPEAMPNIRKEFGDRLTYCDRPYGTVEQADALVIVTEWPEYRNPDFLLLKRLMRTAVIIDGRNMYDPDTVAEAGFVYQSIGRQPRGL
ncbi:MAG: UDP-glucose/GDP-mannose dehydrogenase family protein [Gemmataceae bacterium]